MSAYKFASVLLLCLGAFLTLNAGNHSLSAPISNQNVLLSIAPNADHGTATLVINGEKHYIMWPCSILGIPTGITCEDVLIGTFLSGQAVGVSASVSACNDCGGGSGNSAPGDNVITVSNEDELNKVILQLCEAASGQ